MGNLYLNIEYHANDDKFEFITDINTEGCIEILDSIIRTHIGAGADTRGYIEREVYTIRIAWDLSNDKGVLHSDTGNKGLTTGLLAQALSVLKMRGNKK